MEQGYRAMEDLDVIFPPSLTTDEAEAITELLGYLVHDPARLQRMCDYLSNP